MLGTVVLREFEYQTGCGGISVVPQVTDHAEFDCLRRLICYFRFNNKKKKKNVFKQCSFRILVNLVSQ